VKLRLKLAAVIAVLGTAGIATAASNHEGGGSTFRATLTGYEETPTLSTSATGTFKATLNSAGDQLSYTLSYAGPFDANPAGGTITQSHIHFGARAIAGGISAFLCTNLGNGPAGTPACPTPGGTVTGTITAAQIVGPGPQGIQPTEFAELVKALRLGFAYANIHTTTFPAGEIRGQISSHGDEGKHDNSDNSHKKKNKH
jgi:CHRD domain-containing protein